MLATSGLASDLIKYSPWEHKYRSDHRAICIRFWINTEMQKSQEKLIFKNALWDKIREVVE